MKLDRMLSMSLMANALLGALAVAQAEPVSSVMRNGAKWSAKTWTSRDLWDYHTYAKDGGEATLLHGSFGIDDDGRVNKLDMNVNGLTLSGLMIKEMTSPFYSANGYSINMCGALPYIGRNATSEFQIELPLVGDGTNILRKTGPGLIRFDAPVQSFGAFEIWDGIVSPSTNLVTNPAIVADGVPLVLRGGQVKFNSTASGGSPETTVGEIRLCPGSARVTVANGSTVTLGTLSREQGGIAVVSSANGIDKLGDTEKLLVSGRASDAAGELDGSIVTIDEATAPRPLDFVTYDETNGFKPAGAGTALASGVDVTGVADVSEATTISANTAATALRVRNGAQLTLDSAATLTVGDGVHPAGVLFQSSATDTAPGAVKGEGTLAFGDKEGVFWFSTASTDALSQYAFGTKVSGSAGVTFAGRKINNSVYLPRVTLSSDYTPEWTGPTHIAGLRMVAGTTEFPGDIWVDGNEEANSAQIRFELPQARTWTHPIHLSGIGISTAAADATLFFSSGENKTATIAGGVELLANSAITANARAMATFSSPITGPGGLSLSVGDPAAFIRFDATNTYSGATSIASPDNYATVIVGRHGTLGSGPVNILSGNLLFVDQEGAVISNSISGAGGILRFRDSTASLAGDIDVGILRLGNWTNTTSIAVKNLAAGEITAERAAKITALDANSVLTVGTNGAPSAISCKLEDGAGRLSLVKRGTNVVDVLGRKDYSGATTILAGTLRLQPSITNAADIAWWVDASDESTITVNGENRATKVASKNGNGVTFGQYQSGYGLPYYDGTTVNGLKALRYSCADITTNNTRSVGSWLVADKRVEQRTVIMAVKPRLKDLVGNTGVFGAGWRDMGTRLSKSNWNTTSGDSSYVSDGGFRQNGITYDSNYVEDQTTVVAMRHGTDILNGQYSSYSYFSPTLGGYATWGNAYDGYLGFNGEICEAIAFNRYLADDEVKIVENYLSMKWRGSTINADAPAMEELVEQNDLLPRTTDVEIFADATLDLNGVSQTIRSLSGQGRIVNSSAKPATLTVTDGITFRGIVGAGVTLVKGDGAASALELRVEEGAGFGATNGTVSVSPYVELPVTNNIAFWCDASYRPDETIQRDDDGGVTNWISRMGTVASMYFKEGHKYCVTKPTYSNECFNGLGAVKFSQGSCALFPRASCRLRTAFLVTKIGDKGAYLFGKEGTDLGFRGDLNGINMHGKFAFNPVGALFHVNGVDYTDAPIGTVPPPSATVLITGCSEDWQSDKDSYNANWMLGCNMNWNGNNQEMAEVIVYTRRLTAQEIARVEDYLMKKWCLKGGSVAGYESAFAEGSSIAAAGTGVVDAQGADLTLSELRCSGGAITNFSHLTVADSVTLDVVNGVVGELSIFGDVTFGKSANGYDIPVWVDDWNELDTSVPRQPAVRVKSADGVTPPSVQGKLHAAERMHNWALTGGGSSWNLSISGLRLIVR